MSQLDLKIGPKIKSFRRQLGLQANKLAEDLGISPSYLNLIESGKRKIDGDLLLLVCEKLNINLFLNNECKNAMPLQDFVDKIQLTLEDLIYSQQHGYIKGITNIFVKNLEDLEPTERPIHSVQDKKKQQFYVKDGNGWECDKKENKIDQSIDSVTKKQINKIKEWDTAASYCIISEAGGIMTDMLGNDLTYNNKNVYHQNGILVTNGLIHNKIVEEFKKIKTEAWIKHYSN